MLPVVMDYKSKEVALQNLIDEVVSKIAFSVSKNVKIEAEIHSSKQVMMDVRQVALVIVVCHKIRERNRNAFDFFLLYYSAFISQY